MKARIALFAYCLLAVTGLVVWMVLLFGQVKAATTAWVKAGTLASVAGNAVDTGEDQLKDLEKEQRESRLESTPTEAILLSSRIQQIQRSVDEARSARDSAQAEADRRKDQTRRLQLRYVPIIALLLGHIVGAFLYFPKKIV